MFGRKNKEIPKREYFILSCINKFSFSSLKNIIVDFFKTSKVNFKETLMKVQNLKKTNIDLGKTHFFRNKLSDSLLRFKIANKLWPHEKEILKFLGIIYWLKNNEKLSKKYWQEALSYSPIELEIEKMLHLVSDKKNVEFIPSCLLRYRRDCFGNDILVNLNEKERKNLELKLNKWADTFLEPEGNHKTLLLSSEIINFNNIINKENKNYLIDSFAFSDILEDHDDNIFLRPGEKLKSLMRKMDKKYDLVLCFFAINFERNLSLVRSIIEHLEDSGKILLFLPISKENEEIIRNGYFRYEENILNNLAEEYSVKVSKLELVKSFYEDIWIFAIEKTTSINI